ncbi:MAG: hypothetical protein K2Y28_07140 [Burkholderiaceae bacterium]|nr:hypothetical protein [Burkholderiaceae bacterium]
MNSIKAVTRSQAFGLHLVVSLVLAMVSIFIVFFVWYPSIYAYASNVTVIFFILLGVDVTLGPFLTLIVFNVKKKELARDLVIICLFQLTALLYGLHTLFINRPIYVVYNSGRFDTVYANDIKNENLAKVIDPKFQRFPMFGPKVIAARLPENGEESAKIVISALTGKGDDVQYLPQFYIEYETQKKLILNQLKPLNTLRSFNKKSEQQLDALIDRYKKEKKEVGYLPVVGKGEFITFIIDKSSGEIVEKSTLKPFP